TGASPAATDTVKVHYEGKLTDGTIFDSSKQRGTPAEFPLNGVIPCWTEGVQKMKVGGKAKLVCPSAIAYGDRGSPPKIPGGATVEVEIGLRGVGKREAPRGMPGMRGGRGMRGRSAPRPPKPEGSKADPPKGGAPKAEPPAKK